MRKFQRGDPNVLSPAIAGCDLSSILGVETRGNAEIRCEAHIVRKTTTDFLYSICDGECKQIAGSEGDLTAGYTHRDNLAGSRQWVPALAYNLAQ